MNQCYKPPVNLPLTHSLQQNLYKKSKGFAELGTVKVKLIFMNPLKRRFLSFIQSTTLKLHVASIFDVPFGTKIIEDPQNQKKKRSLTPHTVR